ncbi:hypothetical protein [Leptolyngbya sp. FACHB-261]|uniref:hypothetical protein n=1 Tax=Leptolyngbya sp. FACHB-261 TaxID=2692806 RepID=UPI0016851FFC|nr:hypothetical protein [Leptolyngbya sp. FACHB-261]MBD2101900.1 hypothetical protein [Leptolyngbya sp. FACHB-261]
MFKINTADYDFANPNALYLAKREEENWWMVQYLDEDSAGLGTGRDLATAMLDAECDAFVQYLTTMSF